MGDPSYDLGNATVQAAKQDGEASVLAGSGSGSGSDKASYLEKQTRTRRLFSQSQLFVFSAMYLITWVGMGNNMYYAILNGGPAAYLFNYVIVVVGVLAQAACFGELASIIPIAGAQYYWTYHFSPPKYRMLITWMQGWATWLGYVACLASSTNTTAVTIQATAQIYNPDFVIGGWRTTVVCVALLVFMTIFNVWLFPLVPWFEFGVGILNLCFFFVVLAALWCLSPRNSPEFLLTTTHNGGWENNLVNWNVGMLTQIWMFIGFECVVHMGEETKQARRAAPRAMLWSIFSNGLLGLIMIITYLFCMPDIDDLLNSPVPFIYMLWHQTTKPLGFAMAVGIDAIGIGCNMTVFSSATRLTWAWARDGGLPSFFGHVDAKSRVPMRAVLLTCFLCLLLALLNIGSTTYVALGAITSLSSLGLYFSYAIILTVVLYVRLTSGIRVSEWNMGRAGVYVNIFALVYTIYTMIWLPFPTIVPVTASNMNYCGPVFGVVMLGALIAWPIWGCRHWPGPNKDIVEIVLHLADTS